MDKKLKLRTELLKKLKKETSAIGTGASVTPGVGAGVATKYAFGKRDNKGTPKDWKSAPSIPNRPSKAMDYKELWENEYQDDVLYVLFYDKAKANYDVFYKLAKKKGYSDFAIDKWYEHRNDNEPKESIKEGYAQFRNETKMRSKPDQFHQAVKQVKKKVNEINRLFEYMDRLKTELSEGESELKYKKYTESALSQIKEATKKLFFKSTKLK